MSSTQRPRQATVAGWMVVLGSVFSVVTAFEVVSGLRSLETREAVQRFLSEPPGDGLGLELEAALDLMRVAATVTAVCATMTAILGIFALRRDRRARLGLALLAVPLFLSGLALGGFMTSLVAAASAVMWLSPSKEWFAGQPLPEPASGRSPQERRPQEHESDERQPTSVGAREQGAGDAEARPDRPAPSATPYGEPAGPSYAAPSNRRPDALSAAVALTFVVSGLVLMSAVLGVVVMLASPDLVFEELERQRPDLLGQEGITEGLLRTTTLVTGALCILASLAAIGCAVAALARRRWGATGLLVLSLVTAVVSLVASIGSLVALVPAIAAVVTAASLRRAEVRAWFSG